MKTIGTNIIKYRKAKKISQKELADAIGMTPQSLLKIEKGLVSPKADTLQKIMKALMITPNQLYGIDAFSSRYQKLPLTMNIKKYRTEADLSIYEFAKKLDIPDKEAIDYELGNLIPSDETISHMANILKVSWEDLTEEGSQSKGMKEIDLWNNILERNRCIRHALYIQKQDDTQCYDYTNPETLETETIVYTPTDRAKDYLLEQLKSYPFDELLELVSKSMLQRLEKQMNELDPSPVEYED